MAPIHIAGIGASMPLTRRQCGDCNAKPEVFEATEASSDHTAVATIAMTAFSWKPARPQHEVEFGDRCEAANGWYNAKSASNMRTGRLRPSAGVQINMSAVQAAPRFPKHLVQMNPVNSQHHAQRTGNNGLASRRTTDDNNSIHCQASN
jgi:hypothetical protein